MKTINDYAELVKEKHALNKTIAPTETNETDASRAYAVGEQLIFNGTLYDVIAPISQHDVITTTGSGANIAPAGPISAKIQTLTKNVDVLIENGAVNRLPFDLNKGKALNTTGTWSNNTYALNGVSLTVNSDGTISVITESGGSTASTQFILFESVANWHNMMLSGAPSTASATTYDLAAYDTQTTGENSCRPNDVVLTNITDGHTIRVFIRVRSGQVITEPITFKPMIADADYTGGYVPYAKTNRELTSENEALTNNLDDEVETRAKLGAHNFAKCEGTTQIIGSEVQFTVNDDDTVTANTVATTTATRDFVYMNRKIEGGTYKISGSPSGSALSSYSIWIGVRDSTDASWTDSQFVYEGEEKELTIPNDSARVQILLEVKSGQTLSNKIFKPLLRLATDTDPTYQPYAMTNRELTAENEALVQNINDKFVFDAVVTSVNVATLVTDTLANVGTKFYAALNALKSALASDEIIELTSFSVSGFGILQISNSSDGIITSTSTLLSGYHFTSMDSEASKFNIRELSLGNGAGNASLTTIATGTPSGTINRVYYDGTHIFGGTNNYLNYRKYKKISVI